MASHYKRSFCILHDANCHASLERYVVKRLHDGIKTLEMMSYLVETYSIRLTNYATLCLSTKSFFKSVTECQCLYHSESQQITSANRKNVNVALRSRQLAVL